MSLNIKEIFTAFMVLFAVIDIIGNIPIIIDLRKSSREISKIINSGFNLITLSKKFPRIGKFTFSLKLPNMTLEKGKILATDILVSKPSKIIRIIHAVIFKLKIEVFLITNLYVCLKFILKNFSLTGFFYFFLE